MTNETLKKIEDHISKQKKFSIKFEDPNIVKEMDLETFIKSFHTGDISKLNNFYQDGSLLKKGGGRRSVVDTIIACQEVFGVTVNDVLQVFQKAFNEGRMSGWYCPDIKRFVFRIDYSKWNLVRQEGHTMRVDTGWLDTGIDVTFKDIFEDK